MIIKEMRWCSLVPEL